MKVFPTPGGRAHEYDVVGLVQPVEDSELLELGFGDSLGEGGIELVQVMVGRELGAFHLT